MPTSDARQGILAADRAICRRPVLGVRHPRLSWTYFGLELADGEPASGGRTYQVLHSWSVADKPLCGMCRVVTTGPVGGRREVDASTYGR